MEGSGVRRDLIGKIGVMPTRSRHCSREQFWNYATEKYFGKA